MATTALFISDYTTFELITLETCAIATFHNYDFAIKNSFLCFNYNLEIFLNIIVKIE